MIECQWLLLAEASRSVHSFPAQLSPVLPLDYEGIHLDCGYRADLIVDDQVILELKSIEHIVPVHEAQRLTYLKLSGCHIGLLFNFNTLSLKDGIRRRVL